jgi:hypothetical protein
VTPQKPDIRDNLGMGFHAALTAHDLPFEPAAYIVRVAEFQGPP